MQYSEYGVFDFLKDSFFVDWVKSPTPETDAFWERWQQEYPEKRHVLVKARKLVLQFEYPDTKPSKKEANDLLERIVHGIKDHKSSGSFSIDNGYWSHAWKAAAVFFVGILCVWAWQQWQGESLGNQQAALETPPIKFIEKATPIGTKSNLKLPDGTLVTLNSESTLTLPETFDKGYRRVYLEGEAFFDVAEDTARPFTIVSGNVTTTALGTSFNVMAYPEEEEVEVALVSGKVRIDNIEKNQPEQVISSVYLAPSERFTLIKKSGNVHKDKFNPALRVAWKDGWLVFHEKPFEEVRATLERWYGVTFEVEKMPRQVDGFSGKFKKESLEEVLMVMSEVSGFQFKIIEGDRVKIW